MSNAPTTDVEFLESLAAKFEQETQVYLGHVNAERAERLRRIASALSEERAMQRPATYDAIVTKLNELADVAESHGDFVFGHAIREAGNEEARRAVEMPSPPSVLPDQPYGFHVATLEGLLYFASQGDLHLSLADLSSIRFAAKELRQLALQSAVQDLSRPAVSETEDRSDV
jgi:hypothetical protein